MNPILVAMLSAAASSAVSGLINKASGGQKKEQAGFAAPTFDDAERKRRTLTLSMMQAALSQPNYRPAPNSLASDPILNAFLGGRA